MNLSALLVLIALVMGSRGTSSLDAVPSTSFAVQDVLPPFALKQRMGSSLTGDPQGARTNL